MEAAPVVSLLKQHGFFGLAGADGCLCGNCALHGVEIAVACRKSSAGVPDFYGTLIRVNSRHLDATKGAACDRRSRDGPADEGA